MRISLVWPLVGICLLISGCGVCGKFLRTMFVEPATYCEHKDERKANSWCREMADHAWLQFAGGNAEGMFCANFECGFKDGYSEYLFAGGTGAPPPVPPRRYWNDKWQSPEGHQAIEDWFHGYRNGVAAAMSHGYRGLAVVPSSLRTAYRIALPPNDPRPAVRPTEAQQLPPPEAPHSAEAQQLPPPQTPHPAEAQYLPPLEAPDPVEMQQLPPPETPHPAEEQQLPPLEASSPADAQHFSPPAASNPTSLLDFSVPGIPHSIGVKELPPPAAFGPVVVPEPSPNDRI